MELLNFIGFNRKFRGKLRVHYLEVMSNAKGRFLRISKFATR